VAPFEYAGGRDTCIGCADILHAGDMVASVADDRPDRLVCVGCLWLRECDLSLPRWSRASTRRTNLAGVFRPAQVPVRPAAAG
jgi:hypothetical protein